MAGHAFKEEQAGYLVDYAAVMDGFTKLGFGGGGGTNPACCRFGYAMSRAPTLRRLRRASPGGT